MRRCRCFDCLRRGTVYDFAPRLARARDERARRLRELTADRLRLERLVAHRELQLVRAGRGGRRSYLAERQKKLEDARLWLERCKRAQAALA